MSLIEVMIALAIFAIFITAFMSGQGFNLADSYNLKTEMKLRNLAEQVINQVIVDPPELTESLTLRPQSQNFDHDNNYSYTIEWQRFDIADVLKGLSEAERQGRDRYSPEQVQRDNMQDRISQQIAENLKELVWQVMVTVEDRTTGDNFSLSTFIYNEAGQVNFSGF